MFNSPLDLAKEEGRKAASASQIHGLLTEDEKAMVEAAIEAAVRSLAESAEKESKEIGGFSVQGMPEFSIKALRAAPAAEWLRSILGTD